MPDTELAPPGRTAHPGRQKLAMFLAGLAVVPGVTLRLGGFHPEPLLAAVRLRPGRRRRRVHAGVGARRPSSSTSRPASRSRCWR